MLGTTVRESIPLNLPNTTFAPGIKYVYTVNVSRQAITISTPNITDWTSTPSGTLNPSL